MSRLVSLYNTLRLLVHVMIPIRRSCRPSIDVHRSQSDNITPIHVPPVLATFAQIPTIPVPAAATCIYNPLNSPEERWGLGSLELRPPFVAGDFADQILPSQCILELQPETRSETGTDLVRDPTKLGALRRRRGQ